MSKLAEYRAILENQNRIYGVHVIRSDVNVLGRDIDHITEEMVELKANMKADAKELKSEIYEAGREISGIQRTQEDHTAQIKDVRSEVSEIRQGIFEIKHMQDVHSRQISYLQDDVKELKADMSQFKRDISDVKHVLDVHTKQIEELKDDVKELKANMSEVKGDIKALSKGFETMQTRFGWGLVILGILITVLQFLK